MTNSNTTIGTNIGKARRRLSQLWQAPTFLLGVLAFIGVAVSAPWRPTPQAREFEQLLTTLRTGLEQKESDVDRLATAADEARLRVADHPRRAFEAHYLIGSTYWRQAQQKPAPYAKEVWPRAVEHLEQAFVAGPSEKDRPSLQFRLGYSLYHHNKDLHRAIDLMTLGVEKGSTDPRDGYRLLVAANLKLAKPNLEGALSASNRLLDLTPEREIDKLAEARLQHAELLIRKESRGEAIKVLDQISAKAARLLRIRARTLQARACKEEGQWAKAIPIWQELLTDAAHVEGGKAYINYELGWCYHEMKPPNYPENIRVWTEASRLGGPAGQAAGLHLGELKFSIEETLTAEILTDWKRALDDVRSPEDFKNPYIEIAQVRELFLQAMKELSDQQDSAKAQAVAELLRRVSPPGSADRQLAEASESHAQRLAEKLKNKLDDVTAEEVHAQYRRAGEAFHNASKLPNEAERPELLWRAAKCYAAGKEATIAQKILHEFVLLEKNEPRLAEAWFTLGDLYRLEGKKVEAHEAFVKCLQYPDTPFAYRSNYHLAVEAIEKKDLAAARTILEHNLHGPNRDIDRPSHEKSLYKLASLLVQMENYAEAQVYLKNCLQLYPENALANVVRQQLGESCRRLAAKELQYETEKRKLLKPNIPEDARLRLEETMRSHRTKRKEWLGEAVKAYQVLADELKRSAREQPLDKNDATLLRRALFGMGDCYLDGEEFSEGLTVFQELQVKHRKTLEGLYASSRICYTVDQMRPTMKESAKLKEQAMESLRMLLEDIKEMPPDHEIFRTKNGMSRPEWVRWAETIQLHLLAPPKKDSPLPAIR